MIKMRWSEGPDGTLLNIILLPQAEDGQNLWQSQDLPFDSHRWGCIGFDACFVIHNRVV